MTNSDNVQPNSSSNVVAVTAARASMLGSKQKRVVLAVIVIAIIAGVGVLLMRTTGTFFGIYRPVCSQAVIDNSVRVISKGQPANLAELTTVTEEIKRKKHYEKDPNCLYPVLQHHVFKGEYNDAKQVFAKFETVYQRGFSADYGVDRDMIKKQIEQADTYKQEAEKSLQFIYPGTPPKRDPPAGATR